MRRFVHKIVQFALPGAAVVLSKAVGFEEFVARSRYPPLFFCLVLLDPRELTRVVRTILVGTDVTARMETSVKRYLHIVLSRINPVHILKRVTELK